MINFFKKLFGKYPERVNEGDNNLREVYTGPEDMEEYRKKKKITGKVYAGPDYFNKKREMMSGVYAGPEMNQRKTPKASEMEDVYMGPPDEPEVEEEIFECVYMGPPEPEEDIIEEPEESEEPEEPGESEEPEEPEETEKQEEPEEAEVCDKTEKTEESEDSEDSEYSDKRFNLVYAGPAGPGTPAQMDDRSKIPDAFYDPEMLMAYAGPAQMMNNQSMMMVYAGPAQMNNQSMMMVYAGPAQMNNPSQFGTVYAGPVINNAQQWQEAAMKNGIQPKSMLQQMQEQSGQNTIIASNPNDELKVYKRCPTCGAKWYVTTVFCNECGYALKDVEVTDETEKPEETQKPEET